MVGTLRSWSKLAIGIGFTSGLTTVLDVEGVLTARGVEEVRASEALSSAVPCHHQEGCGKSKHWVNREPDPPGSP
jgi:hypothetical protein